MRQEIGNTAMDLVNQMTEEELCEMNDLVVHQIKMIRKRQDREESKKYRVGQRIQFQSKKGRWVGATVKSVNERTLTVDGDDLIEWRVPYCFCRPA